MFYVLWHGGLRLGEIEDLHLEDLDLPGKRLSVRDGKGQKDRTVYLTNITISALKDYLAVRGVGDSDAVFLYHNTALSKSFIGSRLKTLGEKAGVSVYAHRLRHTCATQLLNAGCKITPIQKILGHKNINTTLIYARAYNQTVADDFYTAMERVEERLNILPESQEEAPEEENQDELVKVPMVKIMNWMELLSLPELDRKERLEIAESIRQALNVPAPPG